MRVTQQPDGIDLIVAAARELEAARQQVQEAEAALDEARADEILAFQRLQELVNQGQCAGNHAPAQKRPDSGSRSSRSSSFDDQRIPIIWRIAFMLLEDPVLDYQRTAERIWGPGVDKDVAKNRVNAQMARMKNLGVAKTLGSRRYEIDRARLAEASGLPVPDNGGWR